MKTESCTSLLTRLLPKNLTYTNSNMTDTNTTCTLTETKVFNLCKEVDDMKRRKKAFVREYNAEIKFLQQEINELLNPQEKVELP